jgi:uncharacterized protein YjbK
MKHEEIESKFELSADDFERLRAAGRVRGCKDQLNVYYDHDHVLERSATTLRIRFIPATTPVLTLKVPKSFAGAKRTASEIEHEVEVWKAPSELEVGRELPSDVCGVLADLGVSHVNRIGWMRNKRWSIELRDGCAIDLDCVSLPDGTTFFEAEVETDDMDAHGFAVDVIRDVAASARPSTQSKFERFCTALRARLAGNTVALAH